MQARGAYTQYMRTARRQPQQRRKFMFEQYIQYVYYLNLDLWLGAVDASTRSVHAVHEDGETSTATTPQIQVRAV